jgi:hypothetical protein
LLLVGCGARSGLSDHEEAGVAADGAIVVDSRVPDSRPPADAALDAIADTGVVPGDGTLEIVLIPSARVSLAVWLEDERSGHFSTVALTEAVALRGIGNRPGALQMNSGFRWPYGRREGVLPYWAHRRVAFGGRTFPRVIFQDRGSEGFADRTTTDFSRDDYFCLSFDVETTRRDALDAVSCASQFHSDKGRFLTEVDVASGYGEPFESAPGVGAVRTLSLASLYPPRRDVSSVRDNDHPDVARYDAVAREAIPEIDAITLATPPAGRRQTFRVELPAALMDGTVVVHIEANTEGDYAPGYDPSAYPTPTEPDALWDYWGENYGYPYRGQPSVVFRVAIPTPRAAPTEAETTRPVGHMTVEGETMSLHPMDDMVDDPDAAPGSGADRLRVAPEGFRVRVRWSG